MKNIEDNRCCEGFLNNKKFLENNPDAREAIIDWCEKQTQNPSTNADMWFLEELDDRAYICVGYDRFPPALIDLEKLYKEVILGQPFEHIKYIDRFGFELKYKF